MVLMKTIMTTGFMRIYLKQIEAVRVALFITFKSIC